MTESAINPKIDDRYPFPGVDNDLQGFRDNFASIKSNLTTAKSEISDLLTHVARNDNQIIDLNGHILTNVVLKNSSICSYTLAGLNRVSFDIDYNNGSYQTAYIGGDLSINFKNFPTATNRVGVVRLKLFADATTRKVNFTATNAVIKYDVGFPFVDTNKLGIPGSNEHNPIILDIWQVSNGMPLSTIFVKCEGAFL